MKVLLIHSYYISRGGEDLVFENECKLLSENGVQVITQIFYNNKNTILNLILSFFNPISFFKVYNKIKKHKPQVVHIHNWHFAASPSVIVACYLCKVPIVQTLHSHRLICKLVDLLNPKVDSIQENKPFFSPTNPTLIFKKSFLHSLWIRTSCLYFKYSGIWKLIDKYIVLTEHSRTQYLKEYFQSVSDRFVLKSNFLFADEVSNIPKEEFLLFVGRLTEEKGVHLILELAEKKGFLLKIIGDGPLNKIVENSVLTYSNIEWLGFQDFNIIKAYMAASKSVIFPSITLEGMPMTIIEAFSNSTPVIATNYSAMKTMVTDGYNGYLFERNNLDDLIFKVESLFALEAPKYDTLCKNASLTYRDFYSPEMNFKKLKEIYVSLI
jgi:glycosyltransferase involved in cell wall biosynthesis